MNWFQNRVYDYMNKRGWYIDTRGPLFTVIHGQVGIGGFKSWFDAFDYINAHMN